MHDRHCLPLVIAWLAVLSSVAGRADRLPAVPPSAAPGIAPPIDTTIPLLSGDGSVAEVLRQFEAEQARERAGLLHLPGITVRELSVQGPVGRGEPGPLAAELRTRVRHFDVAAGVRAEQRQTAFEPAEWSGRLGVAHEHPAGRDAFEMRTSLAGRETGNVLGIELGPRLERRLRRGATFFIDGRAAAEAARPEHGWRSLPAAAEDGSTTVGVSARTGITR